MEGKKATWKLALRSPSGKEYAARLDRRHHRAVMQLLEGQFSDQLCSNVENQLKVEVHPE